MVPPAKIYPTRGLHRSKKGKGCKVTLWEDHLDYKGSWKEGQDGGRKLHVKSIPSPTALNALQQLYQLY